MAAQFFVVAVLLCSNSLGLKLLHSTRINATVCKTLVVASAKYALANNCGSVAHVRNVTFVFVIVAVGLHCRVQVNNRANAPGFHCVLNHDDAAATQTADGG